MITVRIIVCGGVASIDSVEGGAARVVIFDHDNAGAEGEKYEPEEQIFDGALGIEP
jgi:hypothetical protein